MNEMPIAELSAAAQTWVVAGVVMATLAAFAWRAWRKMSGQKNGRSCGCGTSGCSRPADKLRRAS